MRIKRDPYLKRCPHCGNKYSTRGFGAYKRHVASCARKTKIKKLKLSIERYERNLLRYKTDNRDNLIRITENRIITMKQKLEEIKK